MNSFTQFLKIQEEKDNFKPHMMYDPETGEEYEAKTHADHVRMAKMGYTLKKQPKINDE